MHDFGKIVYLGLQKSGSSFVNKFLSECCTLEEKKFRKHGAVKDTYSEDNFYFIAIRHPIMLYSSLYRYGLDKKGGIYNNLKRGKKTKCYESFDKFIDFLFEPSNASIIHPTYKKRIAEQIGLFSFRFLRLSLRSPLKKIKRKLANSENLIDLESDFITNHEIKNENLSFELKKLSLETFPQYFDKKKVEKFLNQDLKINSSKSYHDVNLESELEKMSKNFSIKESLLLSRYTS